jgi:threonine dehydrogenase-like Zn-dependent dehydrogenase
MAVPVTPHAITGEKLPTTLGHEFSGTIEEIGSGVTALKVGDRVAVRPNLSDGTCSRCSVGRFNSCQNLGFIGYSGKLFPTSSLFYTSLPILVRTILIELCSR